MSVDKLIQNLFRDMLKRYLEGRKRLREKLSEYGRKKVVFVHELCECSYKCKMRRRFPELERAEVFNPRYALGQLVEEAVKARLGDEEEHLATKEMMVNNMLHLIAGHIDAIDPDSKAPIEIKYVSGIQGVPHEHHILQLRLYLWLLDKYRGWLLYLSPEGVKSFEVKEPVSEDEVRSLILEDKVPMWPEWECSYCSFEAFCEMAKRKK